MEEFDLAMLGRRSIHSVLALISRQFLVNIISAVASIIIFTQLKSNEVGIFTAVIAMQRVISFFTDFGLGAALVQKKEQITQDDIKTAFTLQIGITFAVFTLIFLLQNVVAYYFKLNATAVSLLLTLVFTIFLSSFKTIPSILLERHVQFNRLVIPQIIESLTFNALLIILLLQKLGLESYIWAFLISGIISIPVYFIVSPWRPGIGINKQSLRHLHFGLQFQAKNILATVKDDLLTVILSKILTFTELGYIGFAQRLSFLVFRYVVDSVTRVTFSTYSRMQGNTEYLRKTIEKSLFFVSGSMFPLLIGLVITVPYIIRYMPNWHTKWDAAITSVLFFSLNAMVSSLSNILVNVLDATGRVRKTLNLMIVWTILTWGLTLLGIHYLGFNGVSVASFVVSLTIFVTIFLVKQIVDFSFLGSIYTPTFSTVIMGIVLYFSLAFLVSGLISLILVSIGNGILYMIILYTLAKKEIRSDIQFILSRK